MSLPLYIDMLFGAEPAGFIELREKLPMGMRQHFVPVREKRRAVDLVERIGRRTDLYIGVAPRTEQRGGRDAIENVHVLWADCDSPEAIAALEAFRPAPAVVVNSGNGRHAYWPLELPTGPAIAEQSNRRIAQALNADVRATDAARILRPPSTFNHKAAPAKAVEVVHLAVEIFGVRDVVGALPPVEPKSVLPPRPVATDDVLMSIPATVYVPALTGRDVYVDDKVRCPFHNDGEERTPSLHVWDDPSRGWYCYGCDGGGTIIDFGARLYAIEPRGDGFRAIRQRLENDLLSNLRRAA